MPQKYIEGQPTVVENKANLMPMQNVGMFDKYFQSIAYAGKTLQNVGGQMGNIALELKAAEDENALAELQMMELHMQGEAMNEISTGELFDDPKKWADHYEYKNKQMRDSEKYRKAYSSLSLANRRNWDKQNNLNNKEAMIQLQGQAAKRVIEKSNTSKLQLAENMFQNGSGIAEIGPLISSLKLSDEMRAQHMKQYQQREMDRWFQDEINEINADKELDARRTPTQRAEAACRRLEEFNVVAKVTEKWPQLDANGKPMEGFSITPSQEDAMRVNFENEYMSESYRHFKYGSDKEVCERG